MCCSSTAKVPHTAAMCATTLFNLSASNESFVVKRYEQCLVKRVMFLHSMCCGSTTPKTAYTNSMIASIRSDPLHFEKILPIIAMEGVSLKSLLK
jgi:hypothetical protein